MFLERQQLPVAPDSALVERVAARAPFTPGTLECRCVHATRVETDLEQPAAFRAVVDDLGNRIARAASLLEADQLHRSPDLCSTRYDRTASCSRSIKFC